MLMDIKEPFFVLHNKIIVPLATHEQQTNFKSRKAVY